MNIKKSGMSSTIYLLEFIFIDHSNNTMGGTCSQPDDELMKEIQEYIAEAVDTIPQAYKVS